MSENNTENNEQQQVAIAINAQFVKDISFEAPHVPQIFTELKSNPEINVNVDVQAGKIQDTVYQVGLKIKAEAKAEDKVAFLCEVEYGCIATVQVAPEHIEPILLIEIPRLLFPFARNIIADLTRESGFPPLMINPIDFVGLYHKRLEELKKEKESATVN
ncbi:MAG: protein-export chaperone SecB [Alphaproteobacteria bacterium]|nr:protein-export chaperone SecB [Alphaproteobacteria bacterium]MBO4643766.1 protein-export chaperone SecB [Alphaproteobacteria bacterium]